MKTQLKRRVIHQQYQLSCLRLLSAPDPTSYRLTVHAIAYVLLSVTCYQIPTSNDFLEYCHAGV